MRPFVGVYEQCLPISRVHKRQMLAKQQQRGLLRVYMTNACPSQEQHAVSNVCPPQEQYAMEASRETWPNCTGSLSTAYYRPLMRSCLTDPLTEEARFGVRGHERVCAPLGTMPRVCITGG
eukprot:1159289-Pelagomonas_calceolata.AAC.1